MDQGFVLYALGWQGSVTLETQLQLLMDTVAIDAGLPKGRLNFAGDPLHLVLLRTVLVLLEGRVAVS